jgi:4-amino-4-deoxy-L-arabinose transferase-like glycosyltransferase
MTNLPAPLKRALHVLLLAAAALLLALHFVHLTADFPNNSPWMDWSKYTDEGWYGDAAIRHFQLGHWYVPGDFNPAAALPVWPLAEALVFRFTGVSLAAARALTVAVFAGILIVSWSLLARRRRTGSSLAASVAVLLLAANPFCFVFTRLAITEPLLILLALLALLAAGRRSASALPTTLALGLLLPLMVLTKTTALFLTPAIFWMLFASTGYRIPAFVRVAIPAVSLALGLWLVYFFAIVRPHYLLDYRYLFSANGYTGMTRKNFASVLAATIADGRWMGPVLYPCGFTAAVLALFPLRRLKSHPVIPSLMLWIAGYTAFLAYHNNLQPRYYLVIVVPLTLLLAVVVEDLILPDLPGRVPRLATLAIVTLIVAAIALPDAFQTIAYVRHPDYSLVRAADNIAAFISQDRKSDPTHNPLILSISGSDISLITGLPSICDDFGTLELVDRVRKYKPGWYVAWNQVEDDKLDAMSPQYKLERVAAFPAMDDPDRNLLILYKLYPADSAPTHHPTPVTPRRLRSRLGQQPSVNQLEH